MFLQDIHCTEDMDITKLSLFIVTAEILVCSKFRIRMKEPVTSQGAFDQVWIEFIFHISSSRSEERTYFQFMVELLKEKYPILNRVLFELMTFVALIFSAKSILISKDTLFSFHYGFPFG